ncbi:MULTISPECIES: hypothetical protein [Brevibacterium]|uniref:Uncharacterized protein n=1 Tax=Brevibacterium casei TaxID=33889 RepID=A0A7T4A0X3_9MICO|nr:hypothetical protein [Brevibacterium casei]QQB15288.1 hypothetical protein I6H47_04870 [Brevibacterium casei]
MIEENDPREMLARAERVSDDVRRRGAWYPPMMVGFGLVTIVIIGALPAVRGTWDGLLFTLAVVVGAGLLYRWKSRQEIRPASRAHTWRWVAAWAILYAVAVVWVGPVVLGDRIDLWLLMGIVVALPAFAEAARAGRRNRR